MRRNILYIILFFAFLKIPAQSKRTEITGKVTSDSLSVENIHIINITSKKATITNSQGMFSLKVQLADTILVSAIQFNNKLLVIEKSHIKNSKFEIHLTQSINSLDEVTVKNHPFTGYLQNDVTNYELKNNVDEFTLNLPNAGKAPKNEVERIGLRFNQFSGVIGSLYGWISGESKKLKKIEKLAIEDYYLNEIRTFIKDSFFINELKIPKDSINRFLEFSKSKNIIGLYKENKKVELIDILVKESSIFLKEIKHDKK